MIQTHRCPPVQQFWTSLHSKWWKSTVNFVNPLTNLEILLGIPNENEINLIEHYYLAILHAKYYIYV